MPPSLRRPRRQPAIAGRRLSALALVALGALGACAGLRAPAGLGLAVRERDELRREMVGSTYYLAASMRVGDFFGDPTRLLADPRPADMLVFTTQDGTKLEPPHLGDPIVVAGTEVKVTGVSYPDDHAGLATKPSGHTWIELSRLDGDAEGGGGPPLVLVLPRRIDSEEEFRRHVQALLGSLAWADSWLALRSTEMRAAIDQKRIEPGMNRGELYAAMGPPQNRGDVEREGAIEVVAHYGDLRVTLTGGVVSGVVSQSAQKAERDRLAAEERARQDAEEAARQQAEAAARAQEAELAAARRAELEAAQKERQAKAAEGRKVAQQAAEEQRRLDELKRKEIREQVEAEAKTRREAQQKEIEARGVAEAQKAEEARKAEAAAAEAELREAQAARDKVAGEVAAERKRLQQEVAAATKELQKVQAKEGKPLAQAEAALAKAKTAEADAVRKAEAERDKARAAAATAREGAPAPKGAKGRKLGLQVRPLTADDVARLGLPGPEGAIVVAVKPDGAGAAAGLLEGDVLATFDGQEISTPQALAAAAAAAALDRKVYAEVVRDGVRKVVSFDLVAEVVDAGAVEKADLLVQRAEEGLQKAKEQHAGAVRTAQEAVVAAAAAVRSKLDPLRDRLARAEGSLAVLEGRTLEAAAADGSLGVRVGAVPEARTGELARQGGPKGGAFVVEVRPGSRAEVAGLAPKDVIAAFDGKPVATVADLAAYAANAPLDRAVPLEVWRGIKRLTLSLGGGAAAVPAEPAPKAPPAASAPPPAREPPRPEPVPVAPVEPEAPTGEPPSRRPIPIRRPIVPKSN